MHVDFSDNRNLVRNRSLNGNRTGSLDRGMAATLYV